jgi:L-amino acid N-acyltransferase YncA
MKKLGFKKTGVLKKIGFKNNKWIDSIFLQKKL